MLTMRQPFAMLTEMRNYDLYHGCFSEYIDLATKMMLLAWHTIAMCLEISRLGVQLWPKAYALAPKIDGLIRIM